MEAAGARTDWRCPKCDGDGFLLTEAGEAVACECREVRVRRARSQGVSSVIPRKYRGVSFDRAPIPELDPTVVREVKRFVRDIERRLDEGKGLWLMGDVGTGKTTLAMLVSKAALDAGRSVGIYSVPNLLAAIRDTYESANGERSYLDFYRQLVRVDLLHLDDLGAEKQTDWVLEQLYSLVNERYVEERSILVTSNVESTERAQWVVEREQQIGRRTVSRLLEMTDQLPLFGADLREHWNPEHSALG
jgi:DNA replication protein DnaC